MGSDQRIQDITHQQEAPYSVVGTEEDFAV